MISFVPLSLHHYPCIPIWLLDVVKITDLAVIFRPAVLSHPDHEMQPKEHKLSQEVLEFLIAHQDWFMLDVAPPRAAGARLMGSDEEGDVALSSDEEANGGTWSLIGRVEQSGITRRRTITENRGSKSPCLPLHKFFLAERFIFFRFCSTWCSDGRDTKQ